jgi:hypothetical protein
MKKIIVLASLLVLVAAGCQKGSPGDSTYSTYKAPHEDNKAVEELRSKGITGINPQPGDYPTKDPIQFTANYNLKFPSEYFDTELDATLGRTGIYYSAKWPADYRIAVPMCNPQGCSDGYQGGSIINEGKARIAIDIEFTNSDSKLAQYNFINQVRFLVNGKYIAPIGETQYSTTSVLPLSSTKQTLAADVPEDTKVVEVRYGESINSLTERFKIDFEKKTITKTQPTTTKVD